MGAQDFTTSEEVGVHVVLAFKMGKGPYAQWLGCQQDAGDETECYAGHAGGCAQ